jgi:hypothetical protein
VSGTGTGTGTGTGDVAAIENRGAEFARQGLDERQTRARLRLPNASLSHDRSRESARRDLDQRRTRSSLRFAMASLDRDHFFYRVQGVRSIASSQQAIKRQTTFAQTMKPRAVWFSMLDH